MDKSLPSWQQFLCLWEGSLDPVCSDKNSNEDCEFFEPDDAWKKVGTIKLLRFSKSHIESKGKYVCECMYEIKGLFPNHSWIFLPPCLSLPIGPWPMGSGNKGGLAWAQDFLQGKERDWVKERLIKRVKRSEVADPRLKGTFTLQCNLWIARDPEKEPWSFITESGNWNPNMGSSELRILPRSPLGRLMEAWKNRRNFLSSQEWQRGTHASYVKSELCSVMKPRTKFGQMVGLFWL